MLADLRQTPPAKIRLEASARKFHLTPEALAKGFSRLFGISWKQYQTRLILLQARGMLAGGKRPVAEIADELGFADVNYFYVFFKRHTGQSPLQFRRELAGQQP